MVVFIRHLKEKERKGILAILKIYIRIRYAVESFCPDYARLRS